ncbi:MAG: DUF3267 domain-containing protein [Roseburia sp.]
MIYLFESLPSSDIDFSNWTPFIKNAWFRKHFMKFVYSLQVLLVLVSMMMGVWDFANWVIKSIIFILVFIVHELLHILVVYKIGDISLTHSGIFFWLNSNAIMSKKRFWLFMTLPFLVLTLIPIFVLPFISGVAFEVLMYILWINAIIAGSDIINSILIAMKPANVKFCRGYYIGERH